jgi:hypothetical protein
MPIGDLGSPFSFAKTFCIRSLVRQAARDRTYIRPTERYVDANMACETMMNLAHHATATQANAQIRLRQETVAFVPYC